LFGCDLPGVRSDVVRLFFRAMTITGRSRDGGTSEKSGAMAISFGCFCKANGSTWIKKTDAIEAKQGSKPGNHAEQLAFREMNKADQGQQIYAFVQNDFPCSECQVYFEKESLKMPFIFIIVQNSSTYYSDWGFTQAPPMPQVIYMAGGRSKIPGYVKVKTGGFAIPNDWSSWKDDLIKTTQLVAINESPTRPPQGQTAVGPKRPKWFPEHPSIDKLLAYRF
jgi:hypothetical protein